jgi:hypothetical protein
MTGSRLARPARLAVGLAGRHRAMTGLLAAGVLLRVLVTVAYWPAFWYPDSRSYTLFALTRQPDVIRPYGYSAFLIPFTWLHTVAPVPLIQHLMGLGVAVAVYAFAVRRGVPRGLAALVAAPLLLDARTVVLEHYLLAETLFTAVFVAGIMLVTWRARPGLGAGVAAGLLLAAAALTRSVGLPLLAVVLGYLAIRRAGWRLLAAVAVAMALPLAGYSVWYHHEHGAYGFGAFQGRFLWARTTSFVDCRKLTLTGIEPQLCPTEPVSHRRAPDQYLWGPTDASHRFADRQYDSAFGDFARKAILAQPGDYTLAVARDTWHLFSPVWTPTAHSSCLTDWWSISPPGRTGYCQPYLPPADPVQIRNGDPRVGGVPAGARHTVLAHLLSGYGRVATFPGWLFGLVLLVSAGLALRRPSRPEWRAALEPLLYSGLSVAMIVIAIATSGSDLRYLTPALPMALLGLALAAGRVRAARPASGPAAETPGDALALAPSRSGA